MNRPRPLHVAHLSTFDLSGGASRAAYRLHQGLECLGACSSMAVLHKTSRDGAVTAVAAGNIKGRVQQNLMHQYTQSLRTGLSDCILTLPFPGFSPHTVRNVQSAHILNIHWVGNYLSPNDLNALFNLGKPVVWRLSDQWPFTAGCHYSAGCTQYRESCAQCPQVAPQAWPALEQMFRLKQLAYHKAPLTVVSPSHWLADIAASSALFSGFDIRVIPNGIDTNEFTPTPDARQRLGIAEDVFIILYVAVEFDRRKGIEDIEEAARVCLLDSSVAKAHKKGLFQFLCVGAQKYPLSDPSLPISFTGPISDNKLLCDYYNAADAFAIPSREENFPSTVLEAMCCGKPVIGVRSGGIPDQIVASQTGLLTPVADGAALAEAILHLWKNPELRINMGQAGRVRVELEYSQQRQANRYMNLYEELVARPTPPRSAVALPPFSAEFLDQAVDWLQQKALTPSTQTDANGNFRENLDAIYKLLGLGLYDTALLAVDKLLSQHTDKIEILQARGGILAKMGNCDDALEMFNACIAQAPGNLDYILNKSDCLRMANRFEEALELVEQVESASPADPPLWGKRGQIFEASGAYRSAVRMFIKAIKTNSTPEALFRLEECLAKCGKSLIRPASSQNKQGATS